MRAIAWWGGLSPRRRLLVTALALVVAAGAVTGAVRGLAGRAPALPADDGRPGDVLLVPGYGGSTTALGELAGRITAAGGHATVVRLAGDGTGDLAEQANVLNGYVNQALAAGSGPVTVIGYSAGGVVAWLWDVDYDGVAKARRIITLGSPLHGADLAAVGAADAPGACPAACEELVPGSSMLNRLQGTAAATRPPWLSLWTTDDQIVQPPDSARLTGAVNVPLQSICPGASIGHGQLPTAPLVVGIVLRVLRGAAITPPRPADCRSLQDLGDSGI
jgi:triacylglycerol esterase/lipase EstA (alpha/beta hydrolase family)